jgi:hypothetical protein
MIKKYIIIACDKLDVPNVGTYVDVGSMYYKVREQSTYTPCK